MKMKELTITIDEGDNGRTAAYIIQQTAEGEIKGCNLLEGKFLTPNEAEKTLIAKYSSITDRLTINNLIRDKEPQKKVIALFAGKKAKLAG